MNWRRPSRRSRRWPSRKHRVKSGKTVRFPDARPWPRHGRECPQVGTGQLPVGEGLISKERESIAGNRHARFEERGEEP